MIGPIFRTIERISRMIDHIFCTIEQMILGLVNDFYARLSPGQDV